MDLTITKGSDFERIMGDERMSGEEIKKRLETTFGKSFGSFEEIKDYMHGKLELPPTLYIPERKIINVRSLPVIIEKWPIIYSRYKDFEVATINLQDGSPKAVSP